VILETGVGGSNLLGAYVTLFGAFYHLLGDSPSLVRPSSRSIGDGKHLQNAGIVVHSPRFSCRFGLGHDLAGSSVDTAHCGVSIGHPGVGRSIFDVFLDRLLEIVQGAVD
jgi:hypothetical protein